MQSYQDASFGSRDFKYRLVELVAVAVHQIAVLLFQLQPKLHTGDIDSVVSWKEEARWVTLEGGRRIFEEPLFEPRPTLFFHVDYMDYDQYPDGLGDVAGYWAEDRIFGGVVLFDRGESGLEVGDDDFLRTYKDSWLTAIVQEHLLPLRSKTNYISCLETACNSIPRIH